MSIVLFLIGLAIFAGLGSFGLISHREKERRAMRVSFSLAVVGGILFVLAALSPAVIKSLVLILVGLFGLALLVSFFLPIGRVEMGNDIPGKRFDERDIMFARARLEPGSPEYDAYYAMHPENKVVDDRTRAKPGLLSKGARFADPVLFASPIGSFELTDGLRQAVDGPIAEEQVALSPAEMTRYLQDLGFFYGALDVGIAEIRPYHVYSHIGRGIGEYGAPITIDHRYAIVFTVEMAFQMVGAAPRPQVTMETAKQYVEAARVAVQLAGAIRAMGYAARAHIDGNYQVIAPLVARDAGLGEIGRMGLLMTPRQGPRVRLGVVTTEAKVIVDGRKPDTSVIDFCNICNKCAQVCPSRSIPTGDRQDIDGALRWRINSDTCFHYWNVVGTDCARCMAVCPYSHPNSFSHNLIRWGNSKSGAFRRAANWLDDSFYGKQPATRGAPDWTRISRRSG